MASVPLPAGAPAERYDRGTIVLHWTTAALVALLWLTAQSIDLFPRPERVWPRSVHVLLGVTLAVVLVVRLSWRQGRGARLAYVGPAWQANAAKAVHVLLYALLAAEVLLGFFNVWVRGENLFNLFAVPAFDPGNTPLRRRVNGIHDWVANTILVVAGLHAAAGLWHHYVQKDGVLRRMIPGRGAR